MTQLDYLNDSGLVVYFLQQINSASLDGTSRFTETFSDFFLSFFGFSEKRVLIVWDGMYCRVSGFGVGGGSI